MKRLLFFFSLYFLAFLGHAQNDTIKLYLDFPLVDLPYMSDAKNTTGNYFKAYGNPSMKQSLQISNNLYSSVHLGIDKGINLKNEFMSKLLKSVAITSFDLISIYTPLRRFSIRQNKCKFWCF